MYLFDTNIVSELRKLPGGRCCEPVKLWASQVDASTSYLSVVTILEIELGILQVNRRDAAQGAILRRWFDGLRDHYESRIIAIDSVVAIKAASLHVPDPKSDRDALIAASAIVNGLAVVTRNVGDFRDTGANLINPWLEP